MKTTEQKKKWGKKSLGKLGLQVLFVSFVIFLGYRPAHAYQVIVDDDNSNNSNGSYFSLHHSGRWYVRSSSNAYADNYHRSSDNNPGWARWYPHLSQAGNYNVYMRWVSYSSRDSSIPVNIKYNNGNNTSTTNINQRTNGGQWVLLGTFAFQGTNQEYVELDKDNNNHSACADAVKFVKVVTNNPPVAVADSITVDEGGTVTTLDGGAASVLANDTDADGNSLTASLVTNVSHGTLTFNSDGTFSYTHDGSETTADSFTYLANDGTDDSNTVTVTITVNPVNDAPTAVDDSYSVAQDSINNTLNVLANDSDPDVGDSFTVSALDTTGTLGTVVNNGSSLSYSPQAGYSGLDTFSYTISDTGGLTATATVTVNVTGANEAPVAKADSFTVDEDTANNTLDVLANDTDPNVGDTLTVSAVDTTGTHGTVTNNGANLSYTPPPNYFGVDAFSYTVADSGGLTSSALVTVVVNNVNDPPVAVGESISVLSGATATTLTSGENSVLANDTDIDGDPLTAVLVSNVSNGTLTLNSDGTFVYTHDGSSAATDSFTYKASDGTAFSNVVTVSIAITSAGSHELSGHSIDDFTSLPINLTDTVTPLVMIAASNDNQLFFKAYNDYSDLDGDNVADTTYKPNIVYYGYFDSYKCYDYNTSANVDVDGDGVADPTFVPVAEAGQVYYMQGTVTSFIPASGQVTFTVAALQGNPGLGPYNDWTVTNLTTGATGSSTSSITLANGGSLTFTTTAAEWINVGDSIKVSVSIPSYCSGVNDAYWSGNFLNWISMARIDTVRKILFGGHRRVDTPTQTILERTYLPHDAHSWAKYYDGNDIAMLTPFVENTDFTLNNADAKQNGITFCNTTDVADTNQYSQDVTDPPLIKAVRGNYSLWAGNERWQCTWSSGAPSDNHSTSGGQGVNGNDPSKSGIYSYSSSPDYSQGIGQKDYIARVQACVPGLIGHEKCKLYPGPDGVSGTADDDYKPIGLLQVYGDDDRLYFGMMAGSYAGHDAGGILIANMESMSNEINVATDGTFKDVAQFAGGPQPNNKATGMINAWSLWRPYGYSQGPGTPGSYNNGNPGDNCVWGLSDFADVTGSNRCTNWGNPFGEIYLQALRYLSGAGVAGAFRYNDSTYIQGLNTPQNWTDPLSSTNYCARLNIVNFNTGVISYDGDQLDGNSYGVDTVWDPADLPGAKTAAAMTDVVGAGEDINGNNYFLGETNVDNQSDGDDQLCTPKTIGSLGDAGGICPEAPRLAGTYRIAGLAYYAHIKDIRSDALTGQQPLEGIQKVDTYSVSSATAVPEIGIPHPITGGDAVKILPACRNISLTPNGNCALVDFKIVNQTINDGTGIGSGKFYVNWEDSEQGGDFDQDMWGTISYTINGNTNTLTITTDVDAESTTYKMGFGYVLSGTSADGFHVHSGILGFTYGAESTLTAGSDCSGGGCNVSDAPSTATYSLGASTASLLKDPLWYAAKWGNFQDSNGNNIPDLQSEWDKQDTEGNPVPDGIPDNYFYATNPQQLEDSLNRVFLTILKRTSSGTAAAVVSNNVRGEGALYQAYYEPLKQDANGNTATWVGTLHGLWLDQYGYLREDNGDAKLGNYDDDKVIETYFDEAENRTRVRRHTSSSPDTYQPYYMEGTVDSYDSTTGALTFTITGIGGQVGDGPYATWDVTDSTSEATGSSTSPVSLAAVDNQASFIVAPAATGISVGDKIKVSHDEYTTIELDEVHPLWNAREQLYYRSLTPLDIETQRPYGDSAASGRYIKTWIDSNGDGVVDSNEYIDFTASNITPTNYTYFDMATQAEAQGLVNYIRGVEIPGYRNRTVDYDGDGVTEVMRLGDIVNSTPTLVGAPAESFDLLYR